MALKIKIILVKTKGRIRSTMIKKLCELKIEVHKKSEGFNSY